MTFSSEWKPSSGRGLLGDSGESRPPIRDRAVWDEEVQTLRNDFFIIYCGSRLSNTESHLIMFKEL